MGGNVIPNAISVLKDQVPFILTALHHAMPAGIKINVIGSAGKKEISSDVDVLIDAAELLSAFPWAIDVKTGRKYLELHFKSCGLVSARTGVSVHVGIPINNQVVQVDIMAVLNAISVLDLHTHNYECETTKGGTLHAMWADLANLSSVNEHVNLMMSPYRGLVNRTTKELITSDKDQIAKIIIGPNACASDMSSPISLITALHAYPDKHKLISERYDIWT